MARYPFLFRKEDFFVELFGSAFAIMARENVDDATKGDLAALAGGLEIYSLGHTKNNFEGVDVSENLLLAAGLYYLADYSASSWYLLSKFDGATFDDDIRRLIFSFLKRNLTIEGRYRAKLTDFVVNGNQESLDDLIGEIRDAQEISFTTNPQDYPLYVLALCILRKFSSSNCWKALRETGLFTHEQLQKIISENLLARNPHVWDFFPSQISAINKGILDGNKTVSLQMPTSSGKTALCELVILSSHFRQPEKKVLFLAPFRALASELKINFVFRLAKSGVKTKVFYGEDPVSGTALDEIRACNLLISTPEKLISLLNALPEIQEQFATIICDEGHLLDDQERGLGYELLLSKLHRDVGVKFIFLSAIVPNVSEINSWLGGDSDGLVSSSFRPVPISFAFLVSSTGGRFSLSVNPTKNEPEKYTLYQFLSPDDYVYRRNNRSRVYPHSTKKTLSVTTALKSVVSGPVALFVPSKGGPSGAEALALEVKKQLEHLPLTKPADISSSRERLADISAYFSAVFGPEFSLTGVIPLGVAYHHGDLPQYVREIIEKAIVDGSIRLVVCTNTLAEGVNLPIRTMVVHSAKRFAGNQRFSPIPLRDISNIVGRAGRAGKETRGLVIFTDPQDFPRVTDVINQTGGERANGYLFRLIRFLDGHFPNRSGEITNDLFDNAPEDIKRKIDDVDFSLLEMLGLEPGTADFDNLIDALAESTFAFSQSNEAQRQVLRRFFHLRGHVIKTLVESGEYANLRKAGVEPRLFASIKSVVDVSNPAWALSANFLDDGLLDYFFGRLALIPQWNYDLENFSSRNAWMRGDVLRPYVTSWIRGHQYRELSDVLGLEVSQILKLQSGLIPQMKRYLSTLVGVAEQVFEENELPMSETAKQFPDALQFGLPTAVNLAMVDIGLKDRLGNVIVGNYLVREGFSRTGQELKNYLIEHKEEIITSVFSELPALSVRNIRQMIDDFENVG